ncbi:DNA polymerase delta subunit 4 [Conger conger]|uniref:DNA polymerase delta subunit 4 n=1 Tax=Conger conger TaxID=82655 RepID=UPI002A5B00C5|nr:DNA polymerase delta subunit 4 [Conger conger]XP_061101807.1 DNA polymerase delta subunit 4 [Conger conger]
MAPKRRLITDTFKVVKRAKKKQKEDKEPAGPEKEPEPQPRPMTQRQKDLLELQQFDLDWTYGPCSGISRMQRWERAELHGLKPPQAIRDLLLRSGG